MFPFGKRGKDKDSGGDGKSKKISKAKISNPLSKEEIQRLEQTKNKLFGSFPVNSKTASNKLVSGQQSTAKPSNDYSTDESEENYRANAKPKLPPRPKLPPLGPPPSLPKQVSVDNNSRPHSPALSDTISNVSDIDNLGFGFPVLKSFNLPGLNLPVLPEVILTARDVHLKRLPAGDFGFSLRRAQVFSKDSSEEGRTVIFAEPNSPSSGLSRSGLIPGDQLIAVNGIQVESLKRDEIVQLVRESPKDITLTVRPVPELSELTERGEATGEEADLQLGLEAVTKRRYSKGISRKDSSDNEQVWLNHQNGFSAAIIVAQGSGDGKIKIRLKDAADQILEVDNYDVDKANPASQDKCEDLTQLLNLNESAILYLLRQRFGSNLIHTCSGTNSTIIIRPLSNLSIYSEKVISMFKGYTTYHMPPHIYAVAQQTYTAMQCSGKNQSIVLTGYSGSGKTTQAKHCTHYLAVTANTVGNIITVDKMEAIWTVLEAFGNCCTAENRNASRFATLLTFDFDHMAQISAAMVQGLLLESHRVVLRPENESNFHIFSYLWHGTTNEERKHLQFGNMEVPAELLPKPGKNSYVDDYPSQWRKVVGSLNVLNINEKEIQVIINSLGAIFHLCYAQATKGVPSFKANFLRTEHAQRAAHLLGLPFEDLHKTIFMSQHHEEQVQKMTKQTMQQKRSIERKRINLRMTLENKSSITDRVGDGVSALNAFIVGLYKQIFNLVLFLINRNLTSNYRTVTSITVLDCPGFQNVNAARLSQMAGQRRSANLFDFCYNYCNERLNAFFFNSNFTNQLDLFQQQQVDVDLEKPANSPHSIVEMVDKQSQQELIKSTNIELRSQEKRGIFCILDEESIFPGATDESFLERIFVHFGETREGILRRSRLHNHFTVRHSVGTLPIVYNASGWLQLAQENPVSRAVLPLLHNSHDETLSTLYLSLRSGNIAAVNSESTSARRMTTVLKCLNNPQSIKRKSLCAMTKLQMDCIIETLKRVGRTHFVHCCNPTAVYSDREELNVPILRAQIRGLQLVEASRFSKIGFPEKIGFGEFKRRFECVAPAEYNKDDQVMLDDRKATINLLETIGIDPNFYRLGTSLIFLRNDLLRRLEEYRNEKLRDVVVQIQAQCRAFIACKQLQKRKVQDTAIRCLQRNVSKYMKVRNWPWWKLYTRVFPLLDLHRTDEQLKNKADELDTLRGKFEKLEKSFGDLRLHADRMEARLADASTELNEERAAAQQSMEALESENTQKLRLEKDLCEIRTQFTVLERKAAKLELNKMQLATLDNQLMEEEEEGDVNYKIRCAELRKQLEAVKKQLEHERKDEMEQQLQMRKQVEKRLNDTVKESESLRQTLDTQKRRAQKAYEELQDTRLHLQQVTATNNELVKKQNKFDMELKRESDEKRMQKELKEKFVREKEAAAAQIYNLEHEIHALKSEAHDSNSRVKILQENLTELSTTPNASVDETQFMQLRVEKQDLERKCKDQEEELDDLAGNCQQLQATVTRLEMAAERVRQDKLREGDAKEEELQELRAQTQRRVRMLEQQLEDVTEQKNEIQKNNRELEIRLRENEEITVIRDETAESHLRRDLRRTKALLKDAHTLLQHYKDNAPSRGMIKQLKNQLEDAEFGRVSAVKGKQGVETELTELKNQLHAAISAKSAAEDRCLQLMKEKHALESQIDDQDEQLQQLLKKYKAQVQQSSVDHITLNEQTVQLKDFETLSAKLHQQVVELTSKVEWHDAHSVDKHKLILSENKCRELQAKLDLEVATKNRLEGQTIKAKDSVESLQTELANLRAARDRDSEQHRRLQSQLNIIRESFDDTHKKETEATLKNADLEAALERAEQEHQATLADLKLALRRIDDLQLALTDDIDMDDDVTDSEAEQPYTNGNTPESDRFLSTAFGDTNSELAASSPMPNSFYTQSPNLLGSMSSLASSKAGEKNEKMLTSTPAF